MGNIQNRRGPQRFGALTYPLIAEWSGLTLHSVRTYAQAGQFDPNDIEGTLRWINGRRVKLGLRSIGGVDSSSPSP